MEYEAQTDEDLVRLFQGESDMLALGILFERYREKIFRRVWLYFEDNEDTADIVQDIFIKLHQKLPNFAFKSQFKTWLYRFTVNACLDEKKKTARQALTPLQDYHDVEDPDEANTKAIESDDEDKMQKVDKALAKLCPTDANILLMRYRDDMKPEQIARVFEADVNTIKQRLKRSKGRFAKLY